MIGSRYVLAFVISPFSFSNVFQAIALYAAWRLASYWPWLGYLCAQVRPTVLCYTACVYDRVRTSCVDSHDIMAQRLHCVLYRLHPNSPTM